MKKVIVWMCVGFSFLALPQLAAADEVKTERVQFAAGTSGSRIEGRIKGFDTVQYMVGAKAGQVMDVKLSTKSTSTYFNIFAPGKVPGQDEALFIGSTSGDHFKSALSASGDYMIQVYLYRNAARRGEKASFNVDVSIADGQGASDEASADAVVPGTDFNATGEISCTPSAGQAAGYCKFGVKREGNGDGAITMFLPDGSNRVIFFKQNTPVSFDQSQADGNAKMTVIQNSDMFTVTIGDLRFEFPLAVMAGG